jgi:3-oxoadipate enol-lactonase
VFGTSLGGVIAQVLAARHAERIDRLVLSSTFRPGASMMSINPEGFPTFLALRNRLPESVREFAEYFVQRDYIAAHPEVLAIFTSSKRDAEQKQRRGAILTRPIAFEPGAITAPTLVLASDHDVIRDEHTLEIFHHLQNAQLCIFPNATHMIPFDDPARFNAAVERFFRTPFVKKNRVKDFATSLEKLRAQAAAP